MGNGRRQIGVSCLKTSLAAIGINSERQHQPFQIQITLLCRSCN